MRKHLACAVLPYCLALVTLILVPSCDLPPNKSLSESVKKLQEQNESLSATVESLGKLVDDFWMRIVDLERASHRTVQLDPAAREFERLDTSLGTLAVAIRDVQPFADGVRVLLAIGNLTSAALGKVEINAKWGRRMPTHKTEKSGIAYWKEYNLWAESLKQKTISLTHDLRPGHWNKVSLTLPDTPSQEFGYLEISIHSAAIALIESRG
jgi:hypothetical protein